MIVKVNGNEVVLEKAISLKELLVVQQVRTPEYVTVQLNNEFISAGSFEDTLIKDGDEIEFLYFMGGGQAL
ncbi:sulfur carrier protein ThiS [Paradesulfitobacterium ferrireducens]|uniref:sulfur carrier protein ThiS n=1 Tax=Paradesulfitobacterium ferrireducens TaxID=2816476 RepID=UPI001A8EF79B|nr:sulfur carrier protein ThiS [Paradesulfitobacterium ferrireducens]